MDYQILKGVQKPEQTAKKGSGPEKYPTGRLEVGDFFVVPKSEMRENDSPAKFRNRINQAVRTYKQRANNELTRQAEYDPLTFQPLEFSVILLGPPTKQDQPWQEGDVGVWRDA